jgi:signal peptidase II
VRYRSLLLIAAVLLILDIVTKAATVAFLPPMSSVDYVYPYGGVGVFQDFFGIEFSLSFTTNKGAAWGLFAQWQLALLAFRILLIGAMGFYAFCYVTRWKIRFAFLVVLTGAFANVLDYFVYGHVIDMLHFVLWGYDFPVFNFADIYINLGVASLLALTLFGEPWSDTVCAKES